MKRSMMIVALVVVILLVGAGGYYAFSSSNGTSSTSTSTSTSTSASTSTASGNGVAITSDSVTLISSTGVGTWAITLGNTGSLTVSSVTAYLYTPTPAFICSGAAPSNGLFFKNCPVAIGSPLPPGSTVSGSSTGAGPESAKVGTSYQVAVHLAFTSGLIAWVNSTVTATSAG